MDTTQTPQLDYQQIETSKIWYSDSVYTGRTYADWVAAPSDDVQVVMLYFTTRDGMGRPTRLYSSGCDYYALTPEMRFSSHFDDISQVEGHVLYGKYMNFEALLSLEQRAFNDYGEGWLDG